MKIKELAMVLGVSREKRGELEAVLDELVSEGKMEDFPSGANIRSPRAISSQENIQLM